MGQFSNSFPKHFSYLCEYAFICDLSCSFCEYPFIFHCLHFFALNGAFCGWPGRLSLFTLQPFMP